MAKGKGRGVKRRWVAEARFDLFGEIRRDIRDADNMVARVLKVRPFKERDNRLSRPKPLI